MPDKRVYQNLHAFEAAVKAGKVNGHLFVADPDEATLAARKEIASSVQPRLGGHGWSAMAAVDFGNIIALGFDGDAPSGTDEAIKLYEMVQIKGFTAIYFEDIALCVKGVYITG